jgi:hypothetical protein
MNPQKKIPVIALFLYGLLLALLIIKGNYFLVIITSLPLFVFVAFELVFQDSHPRSHLIRTVKLLAFFRDRVLRRLGLILVLGIIGLNITAQADPTASERLLASLILILGCIPTFLYFKQSESGIPFLPLFGAIFSIYYALPIFLLEEYTAISVRLPQHSMEKALFLALVGLFLLLLAYYKLPGKSIGRYLPRISLYWNPQKAKLWAILLGALGLGVSYIVTIINIPLQLAQIAHLLANLSLIAIGILFILQLQGRLDKLGKILLWLVFLPCLLVVRLSTGLLFEVISVLIFLFLIYWCFQKKIPWKAVIATILLIIPFLAVRAEFRRISWGGIYREKTAIEKSILFIKLAFDKKESYLEHLTFEPRIAQITTFAHVVDVTPETVPYWGGKTYLTLLWAPIPRLIVPWKPTKTLGQDFGHRYGILDPSDYTTSCNLPQLVEMYANFGIIGVIIGMFLVGIIYRGLYELVCHSRAGEGAYLIGSVVFTGLANIESDFSLVFGNLIYHIILLVLITRVIRRRSLAR